MILRFRFHLSYFLVSIFLIACTNSKNERNPNVVLISVDTLRVDHLGCYGYIRDDISPNIDALASTGVRFSTVYAPQPITGPSHASLLTGLYPEDHGCIGNGYLPKQNIKWMAEYFSEYGYTTGGVVSSWILLGKLGFSKGYDYYDETFLCREVIADKTILASTEYNTKKAADTTDSAISIIDSISKQPFFLFVHYMDPHSTYNPPLPFRNRYIDPNYHGPFTGEMNCWTDLINQKPSSSDIQNMIDLYDGEIAYTDFHIGRLMNHLKKKGIYENTMIIFTADHGESVTGQPPEVRRVSETYPFG